MLFCISTWYYHPHHVTVFCPILQITPSFNIKQQYYTQRKTQTPHHTTPTQTTPAGVSSVFHCFFPLFDPQKKETKPPTKHKTQTALPFRFLPIGPFCPFRSDFWSDPGLQSRDNEMKLKTLGLYF